MSERKNRTFVFTDKSSGRILAVKKSLGLDFSCDGKEWSCYEIASVDPVSVKADPLTTWDPVKGVNSVGEPGDQAGRIRLLQRKLEILISMRANLHVMAMQMKPQFSNERMLSVPISRENFVKMWRLITREKRFLKNKMNAFFGEFQRRIESAPNLEALESEYQNIMNNVTLGGYAALSRDIEESHVKRNQP